MGKRVYSYSEIGEILDELVDEITNKYSVSSFKGVYGPPRGGLPVAVHLSHRLKIKFLLNPPPRCNEQLVSSSKYLVVDDIVDSGGTLGAIQFDNLNGGSLDKSNLIFATLFAKPKRKFNPHIFSRETSDWVVFPWEDPNAPMRKGK